MKMSINTAAKVSWDFKKAVYILTAEIGLLKRISEAQSVVREAVMSREWTDFDEKTLEVNRLSGEFTDLDQEREDIFACLGDFSRNQEDEEYSFSSLISALPEIERKALSCLHRELKMELLKMRALNETFIDYLNEAKTLASAFITAVCPARGGKLYTNKGKAVSPDLRSIVINNRF